MTPDHNALGWVETELIGLPERALARDATGRLRFVIHAAGLLRTMVLHGRRCCCFDAFLLSFRLIPKKLMSSYTGMEECEKTNTTTKRKNNL